LQFGVQLPTWGVSAIGAHENLALGELAEARGFDSVWVGDHLFESPQLRALGGDGQLEVLTFLGALTARIEGIRVGTCVLTPLRPAAHAWSAIATLAELAGPRLVVGLGVGGFEPEFQALGLDYSRRGAMLEDLLDLLRTWPEAEEFHPSLEGWAAPPRPSRSLEIWIGGSLGVARSRERVARSASGWFPTYPTVEGYRSEIGLLDQALDGAGRPRDAVVRSALFRCCISESTSQAQDWMRSWLVPHDAALARLIETDVRRDRDRRGLAQGSSTRAMGDQDPVALVAQRHLVGDPATVTERLRSYQEAGLEHAVVSFVPSGESRRSLELFAREVLPALGAGAPRESRS
jgi:alkanesulfonate monooxygenase SsuD/methylene tetrahydromethanopterin reductase-like flavin-dependent oxidoreductase (luciferase family)